MLKVLKGGVKMLLNPNCSEAVMRIRTDKMKPEEREKLFKELEEKFDSGENDEADETSVSEQTIFDLPQIVISGGEPYNNSAKIRAVLDSYSVEDEWISEEEA